MSLLLEVKEQRKRVALLQHLVEHQAGCLAEIATSRVTNTEDTGCALPFDTQPKNGTPPTAGPPAAGVRACPPDCVAYVSPKVCMCQHTHFCLQKSIFLLNMVETPMYFL
jgi:hypothetical protein